MASLVEQAKALQAVLGDLSTVTVEKIVALFRQYGDSVDFRQILEAAYPELVQQYTGLAAMVTTQWYRELDPQSGFVPTSAATVVPAEQFTKTIGWALYAPGSAEPTERLAGSAKRMVFNASRDTVRTNLEAEFGPEWRTRWARYASANACPFCRLLATRGAVYRSQQTAAGKKYHDHCRCIAVAVRGDTTYDPPDYMEQWEQEYQSAAKAAGGTGLKAVLQHMK